MTPGSFELYGVRIHFALLRCRIVAPGTVLCAWRVLSKHWRITNERMTEDRVVLRTPRMWHSLTQTMAVFNPSRTPERALN